MKACPRRETLSDFTDGALPFWQKWSVQHHVRGCAACAQTLARERPWDAAARGYLASAVAPPDLRDAVLAALTIQPSAAPPVDARRKRRGATTLATAVSLAGIALIAATLRPTPHGLPGLPPAYGEVAKSMGQIRTACWIVTYTNFDARTGKASSFAQRSSARMTPPALRSEYVGHPDWQVHLLTSQNLKSWASYSYKFTADDNLLAVPPSEFDTLRHYTLKYQPQSLSQQAFDNILRRYILKDLLPPVVIDGGLGGWRLQLVRQSGKSLWRYEGDTGAARRTASGNQATEDGFGFNRPRLKRTGSRLTIWVAPATRRVVRSEMEYYDGQTHTLRVSDNFVYDQPLPDTLFRSTMLPLHTAYPAARK